VLREVRGWSPWILLPFRLDWRQLRHERSRPAAAISGVVFACLLIFIRLGFMTALFESAVQVQKSLNAVLFLMHSTTEALWRSTPFPRARLAQALALPEVECVAPISRENLVWRTPKTSLKRMLLLFGVDPTSGVIEFRGLTAEGLTAIKNPDVIFFDARAKPEFSALQALLARAPVVSELGNRRVEVAGC
jgi:putative ABC transport system permease protein